MQSPAWPGPPAPGLEGPRVTTAADGRYFIVDPDPSTRGEHPGFIVAIGAGPCLLEPTTALPLPGGAAVPTTSSIVGAESSDARRGALVMSGDDFGASGDISRWSAILAALDLQGRALHAPTRMAVEEAIAETCAAIAPGGLAMLVQLGRGTPGSGGGLVLSSLGGAGATPEVISYRRTLRLVDQHCGHAAVVVWVVDAAHLSLPLGARDEALPALVVLRASDGASVEAARGSRGGPGLLGAVVAARIPSRRAALCATGALLDSSEIVAILSEDPADDDLRSALIRARWEAFGEPAIARLEAGDELTPARFERVRAAVLASIPTSPLVVAGDLPPPARCSDDADCQGCPDDPCRRPQCVGGLCRLGDDDGLPCDDEDDCTEDDVCSRGTCRGAPVACDDDNPCTEDACEPGRGCVSTPLGGSACDDGDPCTDGDSCDDIGACRGVEITCDDGDPCTRDRCVRPTADDPETSGCVFEVANLPCDDGDPCTLADQCRNRVCSGTRRTCSDDNPCTRDRCDPATGACRFDPLADLAGCDDGNPCTTLDRCRDGICQGLAATCDDGVGCTFDRCEDGRCQHLPTPGTCVSPTGEGCIPVGESDPGSPCLVCAATDRLVPHREGEACPDDGLACTTDRCESGTCVHRDDADSCHHADGRCVSVGELLTPCLRCLGGGIVTPVAPDTPCDDVSGCETGLCDAVGSCRCP